MISEILKGSFEYSYKDKTALIRVIETGILCILSFLILPLILLYGFSYRVIEIGLTGSMSYTNDPMPDFKNKFKMFIQGLKVFLVSFIYFLPTIAITQYLLTNLLNEFNFNNPSNFTIHFNFSPILLIAIILCFISFLFVSVAIPHMINNNGSIISAFKFNDLIKLIKYTSLINYLKFFIISIILLIIFIIIAFFLSQFLIYLIGIIYLAITGYELSVTIFGYLNVYMFLIFFLFSLGLYTIIISRVMSFLYNEDGLEE